MVLSPPPAPVASGPDEEAARRRLILIAPLVAVALYLIVAINAARSLRPFTPRFADTILLAGALVVAESAVAAARVREAVARRTSLILVAGLAVLAPAAMVQWMPGVALPREFPIPGAPDLVVSAAPWGHWDLYVIPDGRPEKTFALTRTPYVDERFPQLSPDGRQIVFAVAGADGAFDLYLMRLDTDLRRTTSRLLADGPGSLTDTCWSPDGKRLLIRSDGVEGISAIYELDLDTGKMRRFLENASNPEWSPDGRRQVFVSFRRDDPGDADIFVADADGNDARPVIDTGGDDFFPVWSPDGRWLAFTSRTERGDKDVFVARAAGGGVRNLTADSRDEDETLGWTPTGQILFLSDRAQMGGTFLYFMQRDGSNVRLAKIL